MHTLIRSTILLGAALLLGCSRQAEPGGTPEHSPAESEQPTDRVDIPATVRSNLGITFAKVERRRVDSTIRIPGAFELQPRARREYRMTLPGHVRLAVDQYQPVSPGDLLYRFRSPQWPEIQHEIIEGEQQIESADAAIAVAEARLDEARQTLSLLRGRLASLREAEFRRADLEAEAAELGATLPRLEAELRQARTALTNAELTREHALHLASAATGLPEAQLTAGAGQPGDGLSAYRTIEWIEVRATEAGIVEALALTDGAFAESPALVLSTVNPADVRLRALALQADLSRLGSSPPARIVPPATPGTSPNDGVEASVTIGLEADPAQRTVPLLATPQAQRPWIRPGVSAFLEVTAETTGGPALAIPRSAIVRDGIVHVFFRRDPNDPNKAIRVEADMGTDDGRWVAIHSGLSLNDEVVLDGAYELKLASQQSGVSQKGGHFHADGTFHDEAD